GPASRAAAKIAIMLHQARILAFRFWTVAFAFSVFARRERMYPTRLATISPPTTPSTSHSIGRSTLKFMRAATRKELHAPRAEKILYFRSPWDGAAARMRRD